MSSQLCRRQLSNQAGQAHSIEKKHTLKLQESIARAVECRSTLKSLSTELTLIHAAMGTLDAQFQKEDWISEEFSHYGNGLMQQCPRLHGLSLKKYIGTMRQSLGLQTGGICTMPTRSTSTPMVQPMQRKEPPLQQQYSSCERVLCGTMLDTYDKTCRAHHVPIVLSCMGSC